MLYFKIFFTFFILFSCGKYNDPSHYPNSFSLGYSASPTTNSLQKNKIITSQYGSRKNYVPLDKLSPARQSPIPSPFKTTSPTQPQPRTKTRTRTKAQTYQNPNNTRQTTKKVSQNRYNQNYYNNYYYPYPTKKRKIINYQPSLAQKKAAPPSFSQNKNNFLKQATNNKNIEQQSFPEIYQEPKIPKELNKKTETKLYLTAAKKKDLGLISDNYFSHDYKGRLSRDFSKGYTKKNSKIINHSNNFKRIDNIILDRQINNDPHLGSQPKTNFSSSSSSNSILSNFNN